MAIATEVVTSVSLSGYPNYRGQVVNDTTTLGALFHTASSTGGVLDEVWYWVCNTDPVASRLFTVEITNSADSLIATFEYDVPFESGLFLAVPGWTFGNGTKLLGLAEASGDFIGFGYVNRIT